MKYAVVPLKLNNGFEIGTAEIHEDGSIQMLMKEGVRVGTEIFMMIERGLVLGLIVRPIVNPASPGRTDFIHQDENERPLSEFKGFNLDHPKNEGSNYPH